MKILLNVVIAYFAITGIGLVLNDIPEWVQPETVTIGVGRCIASPYFIIVRLFTETIKTNDGIINFIGLANIITAALIYRLKVIKFTTS